MKDLHLGPQAALESVPVTEQLSPMPPVLPSELPTHSPDTLRGMQADTPQGFSRRRFLGLLGGLTAGAVAASTVAAKLEWSTSAITTALYGPDPEAVPSEVPAELRGKAIPRTNEHYRVSPMSVLQDGLQGYIGAGGKPFYRRPDFYMSQADALQAALAGTMEDGSIELAHSRTTGPMLRFTRNYYTKPFSLLDNDPGTTSGIAAQRLKDTAQREAERNTTDNTDALAKRRHKLAADIAETYAGHFADTKDYIDAIKGDGRVSTSELFRYSLDQTEGDIFRSLLDTTLFLKLASRVDITALSHVAQQSAPDKVRIKGATYEGAQLLSSLFYDEFSNQVPLEWLVANVPKGSGLNDVAVDASRPWKDFDPINRDGTFYHIWNTFALCAAVDPEAVKKMTTFYYQHDGNKGGIQHGRIKTESDIAVFNQTERIAALFEQYRVA